MMYPFFFDPTYLLVLPALGLAMWAQMRVKSAYSRYSQVGTRRRLQGAQVARDILNAGGLRHVTIQGTPGELSDHYNPKDETVNLSPTIYGGTSIASVAIAAHEVGHALQHAQGYMPVIWRARLVPMANIGSWAAFPLFFIGMFLHAGIGSFLMNLGIAFFAGALLFHLVTLPVEFNASRRALTILENSAYLTGDEMDGARAVLRAAAWTYVASATMALMQLVRLLILRNMYSDE